MTEQEFDATCWRICEAFPALSAWVKSAEGRAETQKEIRRRLLMPLETRDVDAATIEIAMRPKPPWDEYGQHFERAFSQIAAAASVLAGKRSALRETERLTNQAKRRAIHASEITASQICRDFVEADQAGKLPNAAARRAWIYARIGEEELRDAVHCAPCADTGLVRVLSTLFKARDGSDSWTSKVTACHCEKGESFRATRDEAWALGEYDDCQHVRIVPMATIGDIREEIARVQKRREAKGRHEFLDAFNGREPALV